MSAPECTAPVTGQHRDAVSAAKCPAHGLTRRVTTVAAAPSLGDPLVVLRELDDEVARQKKKIQSDAAEQLDAIAGDESATVRAEVAKNQMTSKETLARLADDEDPQVRLACVESNRLPSEVLSRLARDADESVSQRAVDYMYHRACARFGLKYERGVAADVLVATPEWWNLDPNGEEVMNAKMIQFAFFE